MSDPLARLPYVDGVLSAADVASTAASIASMQEPCGAIPWTVGEHVDIWNHVEAAMALLVGGEVEAAKRAYEWVPTMQREDGSWPMKIVAGEVDDPRGEVNMSAYLAVGIWHHWLVRRDFAFVQRFWPSVRAGLDWVVSQQLPFGGINWTPTEPFALLAGSSSIYHSLRAGVALADLLDDPQPEWELAGGRLGHALREHRDLFEDKSTYSMDWYYPILGGAVRGEDALALIESRWEEFVVPGLGIRCVDTNPWVTGAETCELVLALDGLGDHRRALTLLTDMQHLRSEDGGYWTGWVFGDDVYWPQEHTTYTAAAVILAVDALGETHGHSTAGSGIYRGTSLPPHFTELMLECDCVLGDPV
ncbi:prenyltransferase [Nocardioides sp. cx-173]|uniref:prenyltransferase n=1 Tax=Nocardioides sp. cx-173 TaxID=2898796 RepID=UPI001E426064|nr:prenyltransferase [Nocardioides sp. cx-173]MCD4526048.1 prenyltransferase [Nocardioides sp. cx-173]UGB43743.1 prenyltransferase [Nocardioides sp. cx-173]